MSKELIVSAGDLGGLLEALRTQGLRPTRVVVVEVESRAREARGADAQETAAAVIEAWQALFKDRAVTSVEALRLSWQLASPEAKRLDLALRVISKEIGAPLTPRRLGHWLGRQTKPIAGLCFARSGQRDHAVLWRLREASAKKST